ncbi:hypothetical protein [Clostridium cylindrosporum]|uniref:Uncharacterized protein n=1 Tax=Clostridium cylindrosporum DSM 605 TaxID=1121307 RepID=A0A0J8D8W0_CLOCY|nr:hypothetical protein [Clostridium cylindrosporum]KMT22312.1 hypothetical protein CLCY_17c00060 [Clostridium cylindrosporum DSM 605]
MNREEFKSLSDIERIEFFISQYEQGHSHSDIVKEHGLAKNTVADTFKRNGYVNDKAIGQYVLQKYDESATTIECYESNTKVTQKKAVVQKSYNDVTLKAEMINTISWVKEQQEKQQEQEELFAWIRKQMNNENIIEISKLDISDEATKGEVVGKTFKVYDDVLDRFNKFCNNYTYKKQDILSQALHEFLNKYNN